MFDVSIIKKGQEAPQDDFAIFMTEEGLFKRQRNMLGVGVAPAPKELIPFLGLEKVQPSFQLTVPLIPQDLWNKVLEFYSLVYQVHAGEAAVLLLYNPDTLEWDILVPNQTVTGGHASYDLTKIIAEDARLTTGGFNIVGTSHSHASMSAFWSAIDDKDELKMDGIHITVGKLNQYPALEPDYAASVVFSGIRFECAITDLVDTQHQAMNPEMAKLLTLVEKRQPATVTKTTAATTTTKTETKVKPDKVYQYDHGDKEFQRDYEWSLNERCWVLKASAKAAQQAATAADAAKQSAEKTVSGNGERIDYEAMRNKGWRWDETTRAWHKDINAQVQA